MSNLTYDEADKIIRAFYNEFPGTAKIPYILGENEDEVFGHDHAEANRKYGYKTPGAYYPEEAVIRISASSHRSEEDLRKTLKHELIGHFGLNTFLPDEKRRILDSILRLKGAGKDYETWEELNEVYPLANRDMLAEEYFAKVCEELNGGGVPLSPRAVDRITKDTSHIPSIRDIVGLANYLKKGFSEDSLQQKNFPKSNNESFKILLYSTIEMKKQLPQSKLSDSVKQLRNQDTLDFEP